MTFLGKSEFQTLFDKGYQEEAVNRAIEELKTDNDPETHDKIARELLGRSEMVKIQLLKKIVEELLPYSEADHELRIEVFTKYLALLKESGIELEDLISLNRTFFEDEINDQLKPYVTALFLDLFDENALKKDEFARNLLLILLKKDLKNQNKEIVSALSKVFLAIGREETSNEFPKTIRQEMLEKGKTLLEDVHNKKCERSSSVVQV